MEEQEDIIEINDSITFCGLKATCIGVQHFDPPLQPVIMFLFERPEGFRAPSTPDMILYRHQMEIMLENGVEVVKAAQ